MDWRNLPSKHLSAIVAKLPFEDRKSCTQVCKRWGEIVFDTFLSRSVKFCLVRLAYNTKVKQYCYQLFDERTLLANKRCYRNVQVSWVNDSPAEFLHQVDRLLGMLPAYALRSLTVNATPDGKLSEFFQRNKQLLNHIKELEVMISCPPIPYPTTDNDVPLQVERSHISMKQLCCLRWTELSLGEISHGRQYFIFDAPQLVQVNLKTFYNWSSYSILDVKSNASLKRVELDLPNRIWRTFPNSKLNQLEVLVFANKSNCLRRIHNINPIHFGYLFAKMANLQWVKMSFIGDDVFREICDRCPKLCSIEVTCFDIQYSSFAKLAKLQDLQNLKLVNGKIMTPQAQIRCTKLQQLQLERVTLVNGLLNEFPIHLNETLQNRIRVHAVAPNILLCENAKK